MDSDKSTKAFEQEEVVAQPAVAVIGALSGPKDLQMRCLWKHPLDLSVPQPAVARHLRWLGISC